MDNQNLRTILAAAAAFGMVAYALWSTVNYYDLSDTVARIGSRGFLIGRSTARFEENFNCLKDDLDPAEPVSFIAVAPSVQAIEYYQLAQYALAPVLLDSARNRPLVIVYAPEPDDMVTIMADHPEWQMIDSCGDQVALFSNPQ
jgi:hypothetical protein